MLNFLRITNQRKRKNLSPCSIVAHADAVGSFAQAHSRIAFINTSGRPITNLEIFYSHWSYNASIEWSPSSTLTVRAGVEYPVGTTVPLTTDGVTRDVTVDGGATGMALKASGLSIPAGATFYIRTRCLCSGGDGQLPRAYNNGASFNGANIQSHLNGTVDGTDYTLSGTQPTSAGKGYGPFAVCSREFGNKKRSFAILGDSIARGNLSGGVSFAEVALNAAGYGFVNFAFSGAKLTDNTAMTKRRDLMKAIGITDVVMNFPINDLINSRSVSLIQTSFNTLWTNLKSDGIQRIIQATCTPYTTDATSPGTIVTTPTGAFTGGASSFRSQINTWLRSVVGQSNKPDVIFEFADVLESSRDSGLWQSPPTNTADGLHPSATGATTAGNALASLL